MTPEIKRKISDALKRKGIHPTARYDITGKTRSDEWKRKIKSTLLKKAVFISCHQCSGVFRICKARLKTAKYCSRACHSKAMEKTLREKQITKNISRENRRARELGAEGSHTTTEWETLKMGYGYMCLCCKRCEPEISLTEDHIIPLVKGGNNYISNIQPLCGDCNTRKHTKIIDYRIEMGVLET